jgi:hypothetical protein
LHRVGGPVPPPSSYIFLPGAHHDFQGVQNSSHYVPDLFQVRQYGSQVIRIREISAVAGIITAPEGDKSGDWAQDVDDVATTIFDEFFQQNGLTFDEDFQTLPGRELLNYSRPEFGVTSRLRTGKTITFIYSVPLNIYVI